MTIFTTAQIILFLFEGRNSHKTLQNKWNVLVLSFLDHPSRPDTFQFFFSKIWRATRPISYSFRVILFISAWKEKTFNQYQISPQNFWVDDLALNLRHQFGQHIFWSARQCCRFIVHHLVIQPNTPFIVWFWRRSYFMYWRKRSMKFRIRFKKIKKHMNGLHQILTLLVGLQLVPIDIFLFN